MEDSSELQMLRSRLVTSTLEERRRIERALHDGVQQDLIAISVHLQLLHELVANGEPAQALASVDEIQREARDALDRIQTLASEIYPAILDARGLADALRQAVVASGAAACVEAAELGRYPAEIEAAVIFLWRAVLDSVGSSAEARIHVWEEGEALRVEIAAASEADLAAIRDLVEGAGGELTVDAESAGSHVGVTFPLA